MNESDLEKEISLLKKKILELVLLLEQEEEKSKQIFFEYSLIKIISIIEYYIRLLVDNEIDRIKEIEGFKIDLSNNNLQKTIINNVVRDRKHYKKLLPNKWQVELKRIKKLQTKRNNVVHPKKIEDIERINSEDLFSTEIKNLKKDVKTISEFFEVKPLGETML